MPAPTRDEFNQEVRKFKSKHQGKLKNLLDKTKHPQEAQEFWDNPVIRNYLSRPQVEFKGSHPDLSADLDKYELKIYEYFPHAIPYRHSLTNTLQFTGGGRQTQEFSNYVRNLSHSTDIEVRELGDIYNLREDVYTRSFREYPSEHSLPRFILSPNWKDAHATTCFTILDDKTQKPLVTVFINSWQDKKYFNYMKGRMNLPLQPLVDSPLSKAKKETIKKYCLDEFGVNMEEEKSSERRVWKTADKKSVLVLDPVGKSNISDRELDMLEREAARFYHVVRNENNAMMQEMKLDIPFIDASHHLQTQVGDNACTLYGLNFIQALTKFLDNPSNADRMYALAKKVETDPNASKSLTKIIQEELKSYLPSYYAENGEMLSSKNISDFHINQRWNIGSQITPNEIPDINPALEKNLRHQRQQYFELIDELYVISQFCEKEGKKEEHQIMNKLCHDLLTEGKDFFMIIGSPNRSKQDCFKQFEKECVRLVKEADQHFSEKHLYKSGVWYDCIRPVLKNIMSCLLETAAYLSIINPENKTKHLHDIFEPLPDKNVTKKYREIALAQRLIEGKAADDKGLLQEIEDTVVKPKK